MQMQLHRNLWTNRACSHTNKDTHTPARVFQKALVMGILVTVLRNDLLPEKPQIMNSFTLNIQHPEAPNSKKLTERHTTP